MAGVETPWLARAVAEKWAIEGGFVLGKLAHRPLWAA